MTEDVGPLRRKVVEYTEAMRQLVPDVRSADDWKPLEEFVAVDDFVRVGTFLEIQNWQEYTAMLTRWASSIATFETTVHRMSELPGLLYFEIEERHVRGDAVHVVNSLTVFDFDASEKIRRLDVYLQQAPSGS